jgi:hypothetical protein
MKRKRTEILCDKCRTVGSLDAVVTCEVHALDLCSTHMRMHFAAASCRLIPVRREPTEWERSLERMETVEKQVQRMETAEKEAETDFSEIKKLLRIAKGEAETALDEVLKCLQEDREVPADIMEQLGSGKRAFFEHWNRLVEKFRDAAEHGPGRETRKG